MGWSLTKSLLWLTDPVYRRKADEPFRLSHASAEAGDYTTDYGDWQPLQLTGDPAVTLTDREATARHISAELLPQISARAAACRAVLLRWGLPIVPPDWELIEYALARHGEYAKGADRRPNDSAPRFRPKYRAFLIDIGCLATETILAQRGDAQLVFERDLSGDQSDTARPQIFPVLAVNNSQIAAPFEAAWYAGRAETEPGERGTSLSAMMYALTSQVPAAVVP